MFFCFVLICLSCFLYYTLVTLKIFLKEKQSKPPISFVSRSTIHSKQIPSFWLCFSFSIGTTIVKIKWEEINKSAPRKRRKLGGFHINKLTFGSYEPSKQMVFISLKAISWSSVGINRQEEETEGNFLVVQDISSFQHSFFYPSPNSTFQFLF